MRVHRQRVAAVRIDATGIGAMLAEEATKRLGGRCQGVVFNADGHSDRAAALALVCLEGSSAHKPREMWYDMRHGEEAA